MANNHWLLNRGRPARQETNLQEPEEASIPIFMHRPVIDTVREREDWNFISLIMTAVSQRRTRTSIGKSRVANPETTDIERSRVLPRKPEVQLGVSGPDISSILRNLDNSNRLHVGAPSSENRSGGRHVLFPRAYSTYS